MPYSDVVNSDGKQIMFAPFHPDMVISGIFTGGGGVPGSRPPPEIFFFNIIKSLLRK